MSARSLPRVMIAGTGSGCGKTTAACALLGALRRRGMEMRSFKCGPDYIDPMFHASVLGIPSRNLDSFLCGEGAVKELLAKNGEGGVSLLEGVMGFYDGLGGAEHSSRHLSELTHTPVVLVVNCAGRMLSAAAEIRGFLDFLPNRIAGVLLNRVSGTLYPEYKGMIERHCSLPVLGHLPDMPEAALRSRHLGLITAEEVEGLREKMALLAAAAEHSVDLDALLEIARSAELLEVPERPRTVRRRRARVAVAKDRAFCFHYRDSLDLLSALGAELVEFSPLEDEALPPRSGGLLLGGGYPELYAERLSQNTRMLRALREAALGGMPTIAECGGFMLLCGALVTAEGREYPMAGVLPGKVRMGNRLSRFGYARLTAKKDNLLCRAGESLRAHSFHYSGAEDEGDAFLAEKPGREGSWECVHATGTLFAGYPHLHLCGAPDAAGRFVGACARYHQERGEQP